ncbi:hypothetical protein M8C21_011967 [Ambrosia artemisiifolia]|uniref:Uncharacterized protein n=1 Tax=Ambrosia artemisiifolia TaxID=4212 RepID=A0AAD5C9N6_AMBAR|nr:hypothetical protein M8C21_011967 [Ambrosia artemisiifolia]
MKFPSFIFGFLVLYTSIPRTNAADTISANQILRYNQTIVSAQETFELGFFSPPNSTNHYVGIWYKKISTRTVVWIANRNTPLTHTSRELTLTLQGVLVLRDATMGNVVWSSMNSTTTSVRNPIGHLLDTGNFIIYEEGDDHNQESPIWQSFDFLTDTLLPGMKQGKDFVTGIERHLTSWGSKEDPASGEFSVSIHTRGYPQLILTQGQNITYRVGPWNGAWFSGAPRLRPNPIYSITFGFEPTSPDQWRVADWSQGCRHTVPLDCDPGEGFNKYSNLKLPDTQGSWYNLTMTLVECEQMCKNNCSCTAYANSNISGSGCLLWFGGLIDMRTAEDGDAIYIRMSASELESIEDSKSSSPGRRSVRVIVPVAFVVFVILVSICLFHCFNRKKQKRQGTSSNKFRHESANGSGDEDLELPLFGLSTILKATNNFSMNNKLGEGGFGPVYKAWVLHNENRSLELVAKCLGESINVPQVLRSIHVALLCVQRRPEDRPTMTSVIVMLGSQGPLPSPKEPGFYVGKTTPDNTQSSSSCEICSNNELSNTVLIGR